MKGDFTRDTFDSTKHYQQVLMQQGRAQLDADWNEQQAIDQHRAEITTADIVGLCGGSAEGAAFGLCTDPAQVSEDEEAHFGGLGLGITSPPSSSPPAGDFFLSAGHYYVDGILCENEWATFYTAQPGRI